MTPSNRVAVKTLAKYLQEQLPDVKILEEWPDPKTEMTLPCISILTVGTPVYSHRFPVIHKKVDDEENPVNKTVVYIVGQYDAKVQVDLWTDYKGRRDELYERVMDAFSRQFIDFDLATGLSLELVDYHETFARYDQVGYTYMDSADNSQRAEWRAKIDIEVNYPKLVEKSESIMEEITLKNRIDEEVSVEIDNTNEQVTIGETE